MRFPLCLHFQSLVVIENGGTSLFHPGISIFEDALCYSFQSELCLIPVYGGIEEGCVSCGNRFDENQTSPNIAPESGIFPERFLPRLFERTKVDVIHRLAVRSGKLGEKIPGKTG